MPTTYRLMRAVSSLNAVSVYWNSATWSVLQ